MGFSRAILISMISGSLFACVHPGALAPLGDSPCPDCASGSDASAVAAPDNSEVVVSGALAPPTVIVTQAVVAPMPTPAAERAPEPRQAALPPPVGIGTPSSSTPPLGRQARAEDILNLPPDYAAVQLVAFREKADILAFIQQYGLGDPAYGRIRRNGELWYVLLYGVWATRAEAESAVAAMPPGLQARNPWIRRLGDLQEAIRAVAQ